MERRELLKLTGAMALVATTNVIAKEDSKKENEKIVNKKIMKPANPAKPTKSELKHMPSFTIGSKDKNGYSKVEITVGQQGIIHPSSADHWIYFIDLYADEKLVGKVELEPEISKGIVSFEVKLDGIKKLTAHAGCNLHGIWSSTVNL